MTLTLEQVRQTRFHLARRNGYEPVDVDNFVDKVEATLANLTEENQTLKQQVESLSATEPSSVFVPGDSAETDKLKADLQAMQSELEGSRAELAAKTDEANLKSQELDKLHSDLAAANGELDHVRGELVQARQGAAPAPVDTAELDSLRGEVARLREQLKVAEQRSAAAAAAPAPQPVAPTGRVENIVVTSSAEASPAVARLLQMATEQSERLVGEAQVESQRILTAARTEAEGVIDGANRKAHEALTDARTRADRIESEARVNAEKMTGEAQLRADSVNADVDRRRAELFSALEQERDALRGRVDHLRSFEATYRNNLTNQLQSQVRSLSEATLEPGDTPAILSEPLPTSATPRLDALLNEGN